MEGRECARQPFDSSVSGNLTGRCATPHDRGVRLWTAEGEGLTAIGVFVGNVARVITPAGFQPRYATNPGSSPFSPPTTLNGDRHSGNAPTPGLCPSVPSFVKIYVEAILARGDKIESAAAA